MYSRIHHQIQSRSDTLSTFYLAASSLCLVVSLPLHISRDLATFPFELISPSRCPSTWPESFRRVSLRISGMTLLGVSLTFIFYNSLHTSPFVETLDVGLRERSSGGRTTSGRDASFRCIASSRGARLWCATARGSSGVIDIKIAASLDKQRIL